MTAAFVKEVVYSVTPPKSKDKLSESLKKPSAQAPDGKGGGDPDHPAIVNSMSELLKRNPLTLRTDDGTFATDLLLRQFLEDREASDSVFYYLKLVKLHDKRDVRSPHAGQRHDARAPRLEKSEAAAPVRTRRPRVPLNLPAALRARRPRPALPRRAAARPDPRPRRVPRAPHERGLPRVRVPGRAGLQVAQQRRPD